MFDEPDPYDEDAVAAAVEDVATAFAAARRADDRRWMVEQLLQLKCGYLDGSLFTWSRGAIAELLTEVFPRKVVVDRGDPPLIAAALGDLLEWLDDSGALRPGGDGPRLAAYAREMAGPFTAAMADESRWGMGKRLLGGWTGAGPDPTDPAQLQAAMDEFNALPIEMRDQILGALPGLPPLPALPPVVLAPRSELEAAARAAVLLERVRRFVRYVGAGRELTGTGNLRLADGRELVALLETGDVIDPVIGDRTFKTKSTAELGEIDLVFRLAVAARFARVAKQRVLPTKSRAGRLDGDVLEAWFDLLVAFVQELGPAQHRRGEDRYGFGWHAEVLDEQLTGMLVGLYAQGETGFDELADEVWDVIDEQFVFHDTSESATELRRSGVRFDLGYVLERLEDLGVVRLDAVTDDAPWPTGLTRRRRIIKSVALTDLGTWGVQRIASAHVPAPVVGALADRAAPDLLARLPDLPEDEASAEIDVWLERNGAAALVAALPAAGTTARGLAFRALLRLGPDAADAVAVLKDQPALSAYALVWRVDAGLAAPDEARVEDAAALVAVLAAVLDLWGPQSLPHWLALVTDRPLPLIAQAWRVASPEVEPVLVAVAATAGDKVLAKEARKSLFKLRSRGG